MRRGCFRDWISHHLAASDYSIVSAQKPVLWKYEALVLRRRRFRDGSRGGTNALESWLLPDSLPDAHKNVSSRAAASAEELLFSTDLSCIHTHNPLSLKDWLVLWCVYCMIQRARCRRPTLFCSLWLQKFNKLNLHLTCRIHGAVERRNWRISGGGGMNCFCKDQNYQKEMQEVFKTTKRCIPNRGLLWRESIHRLTKMICKWKAE